MKRLLPVAGVAIALVALSGCSQDPQAAAYVGSHTISVQDVNVFANALCTERQSGSSGSASAMSTVTNSAVGALIQTQVDAQYAKAHQLTYDPRSLSQQMSQIDPLIAKLPASDQDRARTLIGDLFRGEIELFSEGARQVQLAGQQVTQQAAQAAASKIESAYAKTLKIKVNPRYDSAGVGHVGDGFGSMSTAVSSDAKAGQAAQPAASWVASLPASQQCG